MVRNLDFHDTIHLNKLQKNMKTDIRSLSKKEELCIEADKNRNFYQVQAKLYNKLIRNEITKEYKTGELDTLHHVDGEAKAICHHYGIEERVNKYSEKASYITLKDHKSDFVANPRCRLINPAFSEIGKISKSILDRIIPEIQAKLKLPQWKNSYEVIRWFEAIDRTDAMFIKLDIESYYPSISINLLNKVLDFAKEYSSIRDIEITTILNARKCFLFNDDKIWIKKSSGKHSPFDITMGSLDGCKVSDIVGLYLLFLLRTVLGDKVNYLGLYRDDILAIMHFNGQEIERIRKSICSIFKNEGLSITWDTPPSKEIDFLDIKFNLIDGTYKPYRKPNDTLLYLSTMSDHPPCIKRSLPSMAEQRISRRCSDENIFMDEKLPYERALESAGYKNVNLRYNPNLRMGKNKDKPNHKRQVVWFNPPFSSIVKTKVGKCFFNILEKNFPKDHPLRNILDRNHIKLSYCCMSNMHTIIKNQNRRKLDALKNLRTQVNSAKSCNCRNFVIYFNRAKFLHLFQCHQNELL